jgi:hypothetical protein
MLHECSPDKFGWDLNVVSFVEFCPNPITITFWKERVINSVASKLREHDFVLKIGMCGTALDDGSNTRSTSFTKTLQPNTRENRQNIGLSGKARLKPAIEYPAELQIKMISPNHAGPHLHDAEKVVQRITIGCEFGTNPFHVGSNARREVMVEKTFALQQARLIDHVKKIKAG